MPGGTRMFAKGLNRPGTASKRRENAIQAVRGSVYSSASGGEMVSGIYLIFVVLVIYLVI